MLARDTIFVTCQSRQLHCSQGRHSLYRHVCDSAPPKRDDLCPGPRPSNVLYTFSQALPCMHLASCMPYNQYYTLLAFQQGPDCPTARKSLSASITHTEPGWPTSLGVAFRGSHGVAEGLHRYDGCSTRNSVNMGGWKCTVNKENW